MQVWGRGGPGPQNTPPGVLAGREAGGALCGDLGRCRASWAWERVRVGVLTRTSPMWGPQDHPRDGQRHPEHSRPRGAAGTEWGVWGGTQTLHRKSGRETCPPRFAASLTASQLPGWAGTRLYCRPDALCSQQARPVIRVTALLAITPCIAKSHPNPLWEQTWERREATHTAERCRSGFSGSRGSHTRAAKEILSLPPRPPSKFRILWNPIPVRSRQRQDSTFLQFRLSALLWDIIWINRRIRRREASKETEAPVPLQRSLASCN